MFWIDVDEHDIPFIVQSNMDGSNITILVQNSTTYHPIKLIVDSNYLYWTNKLDQSIKRVSLDGGNTTEDIVANISNPVDVVIYKNFIYWSNGTTGQITRLDTITKRYHTMYSNVRAGHARELAMVSANDKS